MLPIRIHVVVALLIAALAFVVGQIVPGLGMVVAAGGSTLWTAWSVRRARQV